MARKRNKRNRLDIISTLPDDVKCHILSFLPTKYSVRTSVLSTKWRYLFTRVPALHFNSYEARDDIQRFIGFVDSIMHQYNVANMQKFVLYSKEECGNHTNRWISFAIRRNVHELCVRYSSHRPYSRIQLPVDIYTSKTLVRLEVDGSFILNVSDDSVCLPSLKTLKLVGMDTTLVHIRSSNFPVLEDLCVDCAYSREFIIDICVSSLKRLNVGYSHGLNLVLNAPALEFMQLFFHEIMISGSRLEYLAEARLTMFESNYACEIQNLMKMVSNVHNLSLCDDLIKALALSDFELPIFPNLTRLELRGTTPTERRWLPDLLRSSPNLEILIFHFGLLLHGRHIEIADVEAVHESLHLKEVKIGYFYGTEVEFQIVEFILKNAKVLNKMAICLTHPLISRDITTRRLLAFPRYSRECDVVVL